TYQEWPATVHNVSREDVEYHSMHRDGPSKDLGLKWSMAYYNTQENYTVALCADSPARCVYFDLDGIIGGPSEFSQFNVSAAYIEAKKEYDDRPHTYHIREETTALLKSLTYNYEQNSNGSACTTDLALPDGTHYSGSSNVDIGCGSLQITDISRSDSVIPSLQTMIKNLAEQFNIPSYDPPVILIYDDVNCKVRTSAAAISSDGASGVMIPYHYLLQYSDDELFSVLAHEMYHLKRAKRKNESFESSEEISADINAIFASNNAYLAVWQGSDFEWTADLPPFTGNLTEMIHYLTRCSNQSDPHPEDPIRIAIGLRMREYDKQACKLLQLTDRED
ncbi:MAG: hypothetical protein WC365_02995, partial [Candidatus Babeliales bacterium]